LRDGLNPTEKGSARRGGREGNQVRQISEIPEEGGRHLKQGREGVYSLEKKKKEGAGGSDES